MRRPRRGSFGCPQRRNGRSSREAEEIKPAQEAGSGAADRELRQKILEAARRPPGPITAKVGSKNGITSGSASFRCAE
jgi:hypothetical protein